MSFMRRLWPFSRAVTPSDPGEQRVRWVPVRRAGVRVTHDTALQYSAVWACVRLISETLAALPWEVRQMTTGDDSEPLRDPTIRTMLNMAANPESGAYNFRRTLMSHVLTWGNGYAEIERNGQLRPQALWPLKPDRVQPERDAERGLIYRVTGGSGEQTILPARDVLHVPGLGFDGLVGYSVVSMAAQAIGLGIAAETMGAAFFGNYGHVGRVFKTPGQLTDPARENLERSFREKFATPNNAFNMLILEDGLELEDDAMPHKDAQFLETRAHQVVDIARWYGVPPHKIASMEHATFSNIEQQNIEFVQDTLVRWAVQLEQEIDRKLIAPGMRGRVFTKLNMKGLLRGDTKAQQEFYQSMLDRGVFSINEVRRLEDMNGIGPDGDKRTVQKNMQSLEQLGQEPMQMPIVPMPDNEDEVAMLIDLTGRLKGTQGLLPKPNGAGVRH